MVSYLTTLFLGKPPGGSLPDSSIHSFASNKMKILATDFLLSGRKDYLLRACLVPARLKWNRFKVNIICLNKTVFKQALFTFPLHSMLEF